MVLYFASSVLIGLMRSRTFDWEALIASRNSVSDACVRNGPAGSVCIGSPLVTVAVITGAVPVGVGTVAETGGCAIFCNEVHPVKRVHSAIIINSTPTSGHRLHDFMCNKMLAKTIYVTK